jgi:hypothetical protein
MYPTTYVEWIESVRGFPSDAAIDALRSKGVNYLLLHERHYPAGEYARITRALATRSDLVAYGPFADGDRESRAYTLLRTTR